MKWNALPFAHSHHIKGRIEKRNNHNHALIIGFSFPVNGSAYDQHVHQIEGLTIEEDGHQHRYSVQSGPPIPLSSGEHFHNFNGETFSANNHRHFFSGRTGSPLGNYPIDW